MKSSASSSRGKAATWVLLILMAALLAACALRAAGVTQGEPVPWYYWPLLVCCIGLLIYDLRGGTISPPVQVAVFALLSLAILAVLVLLLTEEGALTAEETLVRAALAAVLLAGCVRELTRAVRAWRGGRRQEAPPPPPPAS